MHFYSTLYTLVYSSILQIRRLFAIRTFLLKTRQKRLCYAIISSVLDGGWPCGVCVTVRARARAWRRDYILVQFINNLHELLQLKHIGQGTRRIPERHVQIQAPAVRFNDSGIGARGASWARVAAPFHQHQHHHHRTPFSPSGKWQKQRENKNVVRVAGCCISLLLFFLLPPILLCLALFLSLASDHFILCDRYFRKIVGTRLKILYIQQAHTRIYTSQCAHNTGKRQTKSDRGTSYCFAQTRTHSSSTSNGTAAQQKKRGRVNRRYVQNI